MAMKREPSGLNEQEKTGQQALFSGAIASFLAAAPMALFMLAVHSFQSSNVLSLH
jgi:hypothetical protein